MFRQSYQFKLALIAILSVSCKLNLCEIAIAQDEATVSADRETAELPNRIGSPDTQRQNAITQETEKEKLRKSALAGLLVLSLICIVFLVLIILVAMWARRIRMLTRQPLPEQHPGDPLWYLRKGSGSDSSGMTELAGDGSSHDDS